MSLLKLSSLTDSEWYIPAHNYPYGKKGYSSKKFSPRERTIRKCKELAFYSTELPIVQHPKYNMWKFFDKKYIYSQIVDIVIQKNPHNLMHINSMRRSRVLL